MKLPSIMKLEILFETDGDADLVSSLIATQSLHMLWDVMEKIKQSSPEYPIINLISIHLQDLGLDEKFEQTAKEHFQRIKPALVVETKQQYLERLTKRISHNLDSVTQGVKNVKH